MPCSINNYKSKTDLLQSVNAVKSQKKCSADEKSLLTVSERRTMTQKKIDAKKFVPSSTVTINAVQPRKKRNANEQPLLTATERRLLTQKKIMDANDAKKSVPASSAIVDAVHSRKKPNADAQPFLTVNERRMLTQKKIMDIKKSELSSTNAVHKPFETATPIAAVQCRKECNKEVTKPFLTVSERKIMKQRKILNAYGNEDKNSFINRAPVVVSKSTAGINRELKKKETMRHNNIILAKLCKVKPTISHFQ